MAVGTLRGVSSARTHALTPRRGVLTRADWLVAAALLVTAGLALVTVVRAPRVVGAMVDDGVYLATAKALAEGRGYRHIQLPGEPYQPKCPILYPLLLAGVWRVAPRFPENVLLIQILNAVMWAGGSWCAYRLMRRAWEIPAWLAGCAVVLAFWHPLTLGALQTAWSESLYFLVSMAALAVLSPGARSAAAGAARLGIGRAAAVGGLAAATFLTRSIGLALLAAVLADVVLRRQWRAAAVIALIGALAVGGWQGWSLYAASLNAADPINQAFWYDLGYGRFIPGGLQTVAWVAYHNVSAAVLALAKGFFPAVIVWSQQLIPLGFPGSLPLYLLLVGVLVVFGVGSAALWRRLAAAAHFYLAFYLGLLLVWPFDPTRFLATILPLLFAMFLGGAYLLLRVAIGWVYAGLTEPATARKDSAPSVLAARWADSRPGASGARTVAVLLALLSAWQSTRLLVWQPRRPGLEESLREREALVELLQTVTPPEAVICHDQTGYLHLRTGRKYVPFLPPDDPVRQTYPPDRRFLHAGNLVTTGEIAATVEWFEARLLEYLRTTGTTYLVARREATTYAIAFEEFQRRHPEHFVPVRSVGAITLYRVRTP